MRLLPLFITYVLCGMYFYRRGFLIREAVLAGTVAFGVLVLVLTESLSLIHAIETSTLTLVWTVCALIAGALVWNLPRKKREVRADVYIPPVVRLLGGGILFIFAALLLQAVCFPPNSWDGMTYHLSRIEHWIQNQSVAYYPTNIVRQNSYPPFPEWLIVHVWLLIGHDRAANLIQFAAMTVSLTGVSLIARWLGAGIIGQTFAVLWAICLPMGILQATSTQTDYVVTLWLTAFVYFLITSIKKPNTEYQVLAALSLGLAFLSKGYAYAFAIPFLAWFCVARQERGVNSRILIAAGMCSTALVMCSGFFMRNVDAFNKIVYSREQLTNTVYSLEIYIANLMRFIGLHFMTAWQTVNDVVVRLEEKAAALLHIDLNPLSASFGAGRFALPEQAFNEDYAGNLLAGAIFILLLVLVINKTFRINRTVHWSYLMCLLGMFLILSLILRWQPFATRFHTAIFVLGAAWVGWAMETFISRRWMIIVAVIVWLGALPWLVFNHNKPLLGPQSMLKKSTLDQYFVTDAPLKEHYVGAAKAIAEMSCRDVALMIGEDNKEYLLWAALRDAGVRNIRMEHIHISNPTAGLTYPRGPFFPCAVVSHKLENPPVLAIPEGLFFKTWSLDRDHGNARHTAVYVNIETWDGKGKKL